MIWVEIVGRRRRPPHGARGGRHPSPYELNDEATTAHCSLLFALCSLPMHICLSDELGPSP